MADARLRLIELFRAEVGGLAGLAEGCRLDALCTWLLRRASEDRFVHRLLMRAGEENEAELAAHPGRPSALEVGGGRPPRPLLVASGGPARRWRTRP
jgi:hypothetical protein